MSCPPDTRLGDEVCWPGQRRSGDAADSLVERHIHAIEECGDLGVRPLIERGGLPEPCAVHVQRDAMRLCPLRLCRQLLPWWQQAADLALRQLEQQRGEWLVNRRQGRVSDQRSRIA